MARGREFRTGKSQVAKGHAACVGGEPDLSEGLLHIRR